MYMNNELYHHGIRGQKWGVRRFQKPDGSLTNRGKKRQALYQHNNNISSKVRGKDIGGIKTDDAAKYGLNKLSQLAFSRRTRENALNSYRVHGSKLRAVGRLAAEGYGKRVVRSLPVAAAGVGMFMAPHLAVPLAVAAQTYSIGTSVAVPTARVYNTVKNK